VIVVFLYPSTNLYYADLQFYHDQGISDLIISPGPLYIPCFVFSFLFTILGAVELIRAFFIEKRYSGAALFFIAVALPIVIQPIALAKIVPYHFNLMPAALVGSTSLIGIFMMRYRQFEWQSIGRDQVVQNMPDAFLLLDRNDRLIDFNQAATNYFPSINNTNRGLAVRRVEGFPSELLCVEGQQQFEHQVAGQTIYLRMNISPIVSGANRVGTSIVISDVTTQQHLMEELRRLARHDGLTGLNNRETFFNDAALSFDLISRQEGFVGCALMLDIDFFKRINDSYGHAVGDDVLRFIGKVLRRRLRSTDISGRYGGEEFSVWMPATGIEGARQVAEEIRQAVKENTFNIDGKVFSVTVSIGLACSYDADVGDFEDLTKKADYALYQAKNGGRDQVVVYDPASAML
jgi:diguanylate cyclase (GGDEF)-like protein